MNRCKHRPPHDATRYTYSIKTQVCWQSYFALWLSNVHHCLLLASLIRTDYYAAFDSPANAKTTGDDMSAVDSPSPLLPLPCLCLVFICPALSFSPLLQISDFIFFHLNWGLSSITLTQHSLFFLFLATLTLGWNWIMINNNYENNNKNNDENNNNYEKITKIMIIIAIVIITGAMMHETLKTLIHLASYNNYNNE